MTKNSLLFRVFSVLFLLIAWRETQAGEPNAAIRPGVYNEGLGSRLTLRADGRFDWSVGPKKNAHVVGEWKLQRDHLVLTQDPPAGEMFSQVEAEGSWNDVADRALYRTWRSDAYKQAFQTCPYLRQIWNGTFNLSLIMGTQKITADKGRVQAAKKELARELRKLERDAEVFRRIGDDPADAERKMTALKIVESDVNAVFVLGAELLSAGGEKDIATANETLQRLGERCQGKNREVGRFRYAIEIENAPSALYTPEAEIGFRYANGTERKVKVDKIGDDIKGSWAAVASDDPIASIVVYWEDGPVDGKEIMPPRSGHVRKIVYDDLGGPVVFDRPVEMQVIDGDLVMSDTGWRYEWRRAEDNDH